MMSPLATWVLSPGFARHLLLPGRTRGLLGWHEAGRKWDDDPCSVFAPPRLSLLTSLVLEDYTPLYGTLRVGHYCAVLSGCVS